MAAITCPGAIPLKTAVFACARASQYGVTIKREAHIRRSSPHEAGGGTRTQVLTEQAPGKPDQTRSIPQKGYICRASLREMGADLYDRKVVLWLHG